MQSCFYKSFHLLVWIAKQLPHFLTGKILCPFNLHRKCRCAFFGSSDRSVYPKLLQLFLYAFGSAARCNVVFVFFLICCHFSVFSAICSYELYWLFFAWHGLFIYIIILSLLWKTVLFLRFPAPRQVCGDKAATILKREDRFLWREHFNPRNVSAAKCTVSEREWVLPEAETSSKDVETRAESISARNLCKNGIGWQTVGLSTIYTVKASACATAFWLCITRLPTAACASAFP